jgi:putative addiction module killer protein
MEYSSQMTTIIRSPEFDAWLKDLRDIKARARIASRIESAELGNLGDVAPVGEGVSEMRIHVGPGYRVYFIQKGRVMIVLLCGGDKSTQDKDIKRAKALAKEWEKVQ